VARPPAREKVDATVRLAVKVFLRGCAPPARRDPASNGGTKPNHVRAPS